MMRAFLSDPEDDSREDLEFLCSIDPDTRANSQQEAMDEAVRVTAHEGPAMRLDQMPRPARYALMEALGQFIARGECND